MRALLAVLLASTAVLGVRSAEPVPAAPGRSLQPHVDKARGGACVADPATMRREHMNLLVHQRDETVHGGVRGAKASLKACVECHASPVTNSVAAARTDFCVSCHSYAAVKIDCFECHSSRPQGSALHRLTDHHGGGAKLAAQYLRMMEARQ